MQSAFANASTVNWMTNGQLAGQVKSGGGMTFAAVEGAGHMVPMDQPAAVSKAQGFVIDYCNDYCFAHTRTHCAGT